MNSSKALQRFGIACLLLWCGLTIPGVSAVAAERPRLAPKVLPRNPNVIFIVAEGLGWGQLGCYGQKLIQTPHLDQMAAEGMRFTDYYAGGSACVESRYALTIGRRARHLSIQGTNAFALAAKDWTIGSMLKQAGYKTAVFGVWALGGPESEAIPPGKGFDEWFGFLEARHSLEGYPFTLWRNTNAAVIPKNADGKKTVYANDFFSQASVNFIRANVRRPFFLCLAYALPDPKAGLEDVAPYGTAAWTQPNKTAAAMITRIDSQIGALMAQLKELKIDQDTAVFFTSDHGPDKRGGYEPDFFQSTGPYKNSEESLAEGRLRVPLIVRWPGHIKTNGVSSHLIAAWDLVPTAVEIANMGPPPGVDGVSLMPILRGEQPKERAPFFWESQGKTGLLKAVRSGSWKMIDETGQGSWALYDLAKDPGERSNAAEANPAVLGQLKEILAKAQK